MMKNFVTCKVYSSKNYYVYFIGELEGLLPFLTYMILIYLYMEKLDMVDLNLNGWLSNNGALCGQSLLINETMMHGHHICWKLTILLYGFPWI